MTPPAPGSGRAGHGLARERLAAYQRYADLVAEQEAALETGDLEGFEDVSRAVSQLQANLGVATAVKDLADDPEAGSGPFLERIGDILQSTLRRNERIQDRLRALRSETGREVRKAAETRPRVMKYLEGGPEQAPLFDLKF